MVKAASIEPPLRFTPGRRERRSFVGSDLACRTFSKNVADPSFQPAGQVLASNADAACFFYDGANSGFSNRIPLCRTEDAALPRNGEKFANVRCGFCIRLDERPDPCFPGELNPDGGGNGPGGFRCRC